MASWQAYAISTVLRLQVKRRLRRNTDLAKARATLAAIKHNIPKSVIGQSRSIGGIDGEYLTPASGAHRGVLLYLHGGGYFACSALTHRPITAGFASRGFAVFAPNYRLAPEAPFPAAVDDAVAAYNGLLASGLSADQITIAGDSAGGGLTMAALLSLRDAGIALPTACVLFSPWTDLAATGASLVTNQRRDAMFNGDQIGAAAAPYLGNADPRHPLASPIYADLQGMPPMLIHVGSHEVLLDDSTRLAERVLDAGGRVTLRSWPVVPHVWQLFAFLPETRQSLDAAAAFLLEAGRTPERLAA